MQKKSNTSKNKDLISIIVSACAVAVVIAIVVASIIVCKKNNNEPKIPKNEAEAEPEKVGKKLRKMQRLATKDIKSRRKTTIQTYKIEPLNMMETDAVLNVNQNKRKKNRSKTRRKSTKQRANKKRKTTKKTKKSED